MVFPPVWAIAEGEAPITRIPVNAPVSAVRTSLRGKTDIVTVLVKITRERLV
jgi:hypothetical protein